MSFKQFFEIIETLEPKTKEAFLHLADEVSKLNNIEKLSRKVENLDENINQLNLTVQSLIELQKGIIKSLSELTEAQKKSEERITKLEQAIQELTEAQKKSEERITKLEQAIQELTETQKKSEERFAKLEQAIQELTETQKKSEQRFAKLEQAIQELTEAQKKSEQRFAKIELTIQMLIDAQRKTEEELREFKKTTEENFRKVWESINILNKNQKRFNKQLGGITHTIGYMLENYAYKYLPVILKNEFEIEIKGQLKRDFIQFDKLHYEEINILGEGTKNGRKIIIIGESKSQLKKKDIEKFLQKLEKIKTFYKDYELFPLLLTHMVINPFVREFAKEKGIHIFYSYQFNFSL
ncbi:MAG: hypothetical protein KatS3mg129_0884 [Leptospiraceae bacterium]|nr:MAG: hypothetical protein KatS3mg129_0884 [Leptospiraceae bacterium]